MLAFKHDDFTLIIEKLLRGVFNKVLAYLIYVKSVSLGVKLANWASRQQMSKDIETYS